MFLQLSHTKLDVFQASRSLCLECYWVTKTVPVDENFTVFQQIRRAALSVHFNIAEGSSRKSAAERKRFYEISRGSVVEIVTALDIAVALAYCNSGFLSTLGERIVSTFKQLITKQILNRLYDI
jgi:four helix bundle protein